jgi:PAS domain S-box-containing protein
VDTYKTYKAVFESSPDAIIISDQMGNIVLANYQAEMLFGYSRVELLGREVEMLIPEKFHTVHKGHRDRYIVRPIMREMGYGLPLLARKKNGMEFPVEISLSPIDLPNGKLVAAAIRDVTVKKQMEFLIRESESKLRGILDNMLEGVMVIGYDWCYQYVNDALVKQSKYSREELIGYSLMAKYPCIEDTELFTAFERSMRGRIVQQVETEFVFPDKTKGWFEFRIEPVPEGIFVLSIDITQRKKAEILLARSEQGYRQLVQNISDAIIVDDIQGKIIFANDRFRELFGVTETDIENMMLEDYVAPAYRSTLRNFHDRRVAGEEVPNLFEYEGQVKDGQTIWLEVQVSTVIEEGHVIGSQSAIRDITDRKKTELKLAEQTVTTQRINQELEQFTYMVSHDLQEPLRMITGFLNLLEEESSELTDPSAREYIHFAVDGAARMKMMIQDLLKYSRLDSTKEDLELVDIKKVVNEVLDVLQNNIKESGAKVVVQSLPTIRTNPTLFHQIMLNLLSNAIKYRSDDQPQIEVGCKYENNHWVFYVNDNGVGIDPKHFEKIFIVFHRLHSKTQYPGTGIGLAICKKIVEKLGGTIWVDSQSKTGSTFYFSLPDTQLNNALL